MELQEKTNKEYSYTYLVDEEGNSIFTNEIADSYSGGFKETIEDDATTGLRVAQFWALSLIRASWTISNDAITIVLANCK